VGRILAATAAGVSAVPTVIRGEAWTLHRPGRNRGRDLCRTASGDEHGEQPERPYQQHPSDEMVQRKSRCLRRVADDDTRREREDTTHHDTAGGDQPVLDQEVAQDVPALGSDRAAGANLSRSRGDVEDRKAADADSTDTEDQQGDGTKND